ncbi:MAG: SDR family NAD(P)-dependent oxidoreductase, partial [Anaerovoracaceae bacterium]
MLKGKTALITGGSRGIGRAIALALAAEGADVAVIYNGGESAARAVCEEAAQTGVKAVAYACNVADADQVPTVTAAILTEFGGVDILVNNAGITRDGLLTSMSEEDFVRVMEVNLGGAFHFTKSLYGHFLKKRSGRIIN